MKLADSLRLILKLEHCSSSDEVGSSGMAIIDLVLSRLGRDDLVVAPHDCYGGTHRLLEMRRDRGQFNVAFIDQNDDKQLSSVIKRRCSGSRTEFTQVDHYHVGRSKFLNDCLWRKAAGPDIGCGRCGSCYEIAMISSF